MTGKRSHYKFTICKCENGAILDKTREVIDFLVLADALPERFSWAGNIFSRHESATRALALYLVLRAAQEQKLDIRSDLVKNTYSELIDGRRYAMEVDGSCYFVRPVMSDDPVFFDGGQISIGQYEKFFPTLDTYLKMKHLK